MNFSLFSLCVFVRFFAKDFRRILRLLLVLQADWNISVHTFHFVPPTRRRTRFLFKMFEDNLSKFKLRLIKRGYPKKLLRRTVSEVNFVIRQSALLQKNKTRLPSLAFCHNIPTVNGAPKKILMLNWDLIQNQLLLNTIFRNPPIIAYKRGTSLKSCS